MKYFAYGSNMLTTRLTDRVPSASFVSLATVSGRKLVFHKRSGDKSGKCDIPACDDSSSAVHGVLFEISDSEWDDLDKHEGVGCGYERTDIDVMIGSQNIGAKTYLATTSHIENGLIPYDWYYCLVVAGAREQKLPEDYIKSIASVPCKDDPNPSRKTRLEALDALKAAGTPYSPTCRTSGCYQQTTRHESKTCGQMSVEQDGAPK